MTGLFMYFLPLSIKATVTIPLIVFARFIIRKQPKIYSYVLWFVVFAGLVVNISISIDNISPVFTPVTDMRYAAGSRYTEIIDDYVGETQVFHEDTMEYYDAVENDILPAFDRESGSNYVVVSNGKIEKPETVGSYIMPKLSAVWLAGVIAAVFVVLKNFLDFHGRLAFARKKQDNIYFSDNISSPLVYGFVNPKIYIPSHMENMPLEHIISHEQTHIRRCDHIVKPLALAIVIIHWFNPLVWLAFNLMCKDMEMSCDETVVNRIGGKKMYSMQLLDCAADKSANPVRAVLFGESNTESRIKNILSYKRPAKMISLLLTAVVAICFTACVVEEKVEEIIPTPAPKTFYEQLAELNSTEDVQYKERELIEGAQVIKNTDVTLASEMYVTTVMPKEITNESIARTGLHYNCLTGTVTQRKDGPFSSFAYVLKNSEKLHICYADETEYVQDTVDMPRGHSVMCVATGLEMLGDDIQFLSYYTTDTAGDVWLNIQKEKDGEKQLYQHKMDKDNLFLLRGLRFINENVGFMGQTDLGYIKEGSTASSYTKYDVPVANITIDGGKTWHKLDFSQLTYPECFKGYNACCMVVLDDMIEIRYFAKVTPEYKDKVKGIYPFSTSTENYSIISEDGGLTWTGYLRVRNNRLGIGYTHQKVTETIPVQIID